MPRVGGIYSLPVGYHADPGTTIRSAQHNEPLEDIAQALTESLPRDGSAPMTGPLTLSSDPTADMHAAPKRFVVAKAGDDMTGPLTISASYARINLKNTVTSDPLKAEVAFMVDNATGNFEIHSRNRDGYGFISTDYQIEKGSSGASRHRFGISGSWEAEIQPIASGLVNANTIVTRKTGDERYLKLSDVVNFLHPVGDIILTAGNSGAQNPNTRFPGTTWAQISQGRAIVGVGTADGVTWTAGQTRGLANETLSISQIPSHSHGGSIWSGGVHTHGADIGGGLTSGTGFTIRGFGGGTVITSAWGYASTSLSGSMSAIQGTGNSESQNLVLSLSHSHSVSIYDGGSHSHGVTIYDNGGGGSHNNIQPSIALYIWQRTA